MSGITDDTLLVIQSAGIPRFSARGLTQTIKQIARADLERDVNGTLLNFSPSQFRKYQIKISCTDQRVPALDGVWLGTELTVHCITELAYQSGGSPNRTPVSGSEREEEGFVFYRPVLTVMVTDYSTQFDEWGAIVQWEITAEEV